jgi:hypothetical protein
MMTGTALSFVLTFGADAPYADEWEFVPALLGKEPLGPWLWMQHNEHRLPLSRLIYFGLFQLTHDFRTGMVLQISMLAFLSLGLLRLAAQLRGRPDWPDLFFPISLLHLGHWENFLMGYQICFVLFCCLTTCLGVVALRTRRETAFRSGVAAGILLTAIALTGGVGLAMIPFASLWLVYLAAVVWRSGSPARSALLVLLALAPVVYLAVYFDGYQRPPHHPKPSSDPIAVGMVTGEVLAMAFGMGLSGLWQVVLAFEVVIGVGTIVLVTRQSIHSTTRPGALGLLAVAAGVSALALAIGMGRGSFGRDMGLWSRYSLLTWPLLGLAYLVCVRAGRRDVPLALCLVAAIALLPNLGTGMRNGLEIREHYSQIQADAEQGLPAQEIVLRRFPDSLNTGQMERAVKNIPLLREARIGIFRSGTP